ncbi:MAG: transferrin-binding protein-like solute binding protein [Desulfobacter sp.]|nr:MAG: transferrin-binding protein-like solute binding protein [Desulfobacter sp.]
MSFFRQVLIYMVLAVALAAGSPDNSGAAARDPIGKIVAIRGKATASMEGAAPRVLSLKAPVFLKETIETARGRLQIMFTDNTLMTLGRNAKMVLEEYQWKKGSPQSRLHTKIKAGSFRVMGGAITRDAPQNFKTEAPSATIGIRGSMYAGIVRGNRLSVVYQGGRGIFVSNPQGRVDIDRPGFGTEVAGMGAPPDEPKPFDETRMEEIEGGMAVAEEPSGGQDTEGGTDDAGTQGEDAGETDGSDSGVSQEGTASGDDAGTQEQDGGEGGDPATADAFAEGEADAGSSFETGTPDVTSDSTGEIEPVLTTPETVTAGLADATAQEAVPVAANSYEQGIFDVLAELGFVGARSTSLPGLGIWTYAGLIRDSDPTITDDTFVVHVNWYGKRFIGFEKDPSYPGMTTNGFAIGQIDSTGALVNVRLLGSGDPAGAGGPGVISALTGSEDFGHVYGTNQGAVGLALSGTDYELASPYSTHAWSDVSAATFDKVSTSPDPGNAWNGFFVGLGEDMNNIDTDRVYFINDDSAKFSMGFNRATGTISGTMTGIDAFGGGNQINNLQIGGASVTQSAYIADDRLGAELIGTSAVITQNGGSTGLKSWGNFLVSSMETPLSDNTYWGYWEIAYKEPGSNYDYHVHVPGSLWIAGDRTPNTVVQSLTGTFSYTGGAMGIMIDSGVSPQVSQLTNGQTSLNVDFSGKTISGNINFSQVNLTVTVAAADFLAGGSTGFTGTISGAATSQVNGAFFGANAQGLGGNFAADFGSVKYMGIFAGDRP